MIEFVLNNKKVKTDLASGTTVLDFVRYHKHLSGTKIGCREGDCGACTVLVGRLMDGEVHYQTMTSCLMPLGNAQGKHIVSVEGLNMEELSPVQKTIVEQGGTQCGFCTVGFVMSLTGYAMSPKKPEYSDGIAAIDGNICRCTGYKSLERATADLTNLLTDKNLKQPLSWLVENKFIPKYFKDVKTWLTEIPKPNESISKTETTEVVVAGGTDLIVQRPEEVADASVHHYFDTNGIPKISKQDNRIVIAANATAEDIQSSEIMQSIFPNIRKHFKWVSSTPIRNMGTVAGNFVNGSPIGDLTIYFLALDASVHLKKGSNARTVKLQHFYKGYKQLDKEKEELVETISFQIPDKEVKFSFEKVCKREHLDIASVNSACSIKMKDQEIESIHASAGGVGPTPKYLSNTVSFLKGKKVNAQTLHEANAIMQDEISPISDARGTEAYKRLLLRQLFYAHFLTHFPKLVTMQNLSELA